MAPFEFFTETTAVHVPGFPQYLAEIWDHLYPGSTPPIYRVFYNRPDGGATEFVATVHLRSEPRADGNVQAVTSGVSTQATRAIQEAAGDAIVFLRTYDPVMRQCTRYVYFPRLDLANGDVLFPNPGDTSSALTAILRYTTLLHQYLHVTLLQFASLRANVAMAEMARASGAGSSRHPPRFPTFTRSSLDQIRRGLIPTPAPHGSPPPFSTRSSTTRHFARFTPVRPTGSRAQRRRVRADTPTRSGDSRGDLASPDYSPEGEDIDIIAPATPLEMEF